MYLCKSLLQTCKKLYIMFGLMDFKYNKILLMRLALNRTGDELSDIPNYQTVPTRT